MLNSLMPNERKQLNKSHILLAVSLTVAIQEVGPISTSRHTESPAVSHSHVPPYPYVLYKALLLRKKICKLYCPLFSVSFSLKILKTAQKRGHPALYLIQDPSETNK